MTSNAPLTERLTHQLDAAFPELVDTHAPMVLTLATRLTDSSTGQDITQEVFLRAYRALSRYSPERIRTLHVRAWLVTITRNLVKNEYRRQSRKSTVPLSDDDSQFAQEDGPATVDSQDQLHGLLSTLSDAQREAVVLRHIVGLPIQEVALAMACPTGTAKSHVSRGLSQLRALLAADPSTDREGENR